jgi:hypothetical protein
MPGSELTGDPSLRTLASLALGLKALEEKIETRFAASDKAVQLLQEFANRQPTTEAVDTNLKALDRLMEAKNGSLEKLVDTKFDGNKTALDAALLTQGKTLDEIKVSFGKQFDSLAKMIDDLKERINRNDGRTVGLGAAGSILLGVGSLIVVALAIVGFIIART